MAELNLTELNNILDGIRKPSTRNAFARNSIAAGVRVVEKAVRARSPRSKFPPRRGNLRRSIGQASPDNIRPYRPIPQDTVRTLIFRRGDARGVNGKRSGYHAHLVIEGTTARRKENGRSTGRMPANDFVSPAVLTTMGDFQRAMVREVQRGLTRFRNKQRIRNEGG